MRTIIIIFLIALLLQAPYSSAWSNGGPSLAPENPNYGTHDWITEHALDWLPEEEKKYILDNLADYLYETEIPDFVIGDQDKHHVYFSYNGNLVDDASALRAQQEFEKVIGELATSNYKLAAKHAGITSHYIADLAVFGHVMSTTYWGAEKHHLEYESWVQNFTTNYSSEFDYYLIFDGSLR